MGKGSLTVNYDAWNPPFLASCLWTPVGGLERVVKSVHKNVVKLHEKVKNKKDQRI